MSYRSILRKLPIGLFAAAFASSCHVADFFEEEGDKGSGNATQTSPTVLGQGISQRAGAADVSALDAIYSIEVTTPPASIRPDPDMYVRRLLLQHHGEEATTARLIGSVEAFRSLAGGASVDFTTLPQASYDATSLLTTSQVAGEVCEALVAPNSSQHDDWQTILPSSPDDWEVNSRYLAQRILGVPSTSISSDTISRLRVILDLEVTVGGEIEFDDYVAVCVALTMDARALFL